mgnify:CR=1 FL=1
MHTEPVRPNSASASATSISAARTSNLGNISIPPETASAATAATTSTYNRSCTHHSAATTATARVQFTSRFSKFSGGKPLSSTATYRSSVKPFFAIRAVRAAGSVITIGNNTTAATTTTSPTRAGTTCRCSISFSCTFTSRHGQVCSPARRTAVHVWSSRAVTDGYLITSLTSNSLDSSRVTAAASTISRVIGRTACRFAGPTTTTATNHKHINDFRLEEHNSSARQQLHHTVFSHHVVPCVGKFQLRLTTGTNRGTTYTCHINLRSRPPKRRPCLFFV